MLHVPPRHGVCGEVLLSLRVHLLFVHAPRALRPNGRAGDRGEVQRVHANARAGAALPDRHLWLLRGEARCPHVDALAEHPPQKREVRVRITASHAFTVARANLTSRCPLLLLRYKTRDHVFVDLNGYILYSIIMEQVADAHYKLEDPNQQIRQYVDDALRSEVAKHPVDQLFHLRDAVNLAVQRNVSHLIAQYGYVIDKIAITRLAPDRAVMASMNNIVAQKRLKEAEAHRAAAIKIFEVKRAEGDAEASYLSGIGTSKQRAAIQEGFDEMVGEFSEYTGLEEETVRSIIYTTQYFDSQEGMIAGKRGHPSRILLGHSPSALIHHTSQLHETLGTDYVRFANFPSADQQVMLRDKWTAVMEEKNRLKQEEFERQLRDKPGAMSPAPVETNPLLPPDGEDPVLTSTSI
uniref:Band 7 domain-containing protein n=1 Tax=Phaeomonas parva TaxID=124430 RepID=A0A7S1XSR3_9STRA|mmetsp:Transcript_33697/g.106496  ORF Transcript_33697/g.106496 Transcript_33697/m.106496 type:complete len:408 (+) Transcript_33697:215-1438(+)